MLDAPHTLIAVEPQRATPAPDTPFDLALARLDVGLFDAIESYTTERDRRSLLACQLGMRTVADGYVYLEIGSYIGGSLQPHVLDPRCRRAYAIDKRPARQSDERGVSFAYHGNTAARMMRGLAQLSPEGAGKVVCIDADARDVAAEGIDPKPQLCFIDGEHTDEAVVRDFAFCRQVVAPGGAIVFHDAQIVYLGLDAIVRGLERDGLRFRAYHLPDAVFVIELEGCRLHETSAIHDMLINNHVGYLATLRINDHYRVFANWPLFRAIRAIKVRLSGRL